MIYHNLLIYLAAIFLLSIDNVPAEPTVSLPESLFIMLGGASLFALVSSRQFRRSAAQTTAGYFTTEKRLSILAVIFFGTVLFSSDITYYLAQLGPGTSLPVIDNLFGLMLFFCFLAIMWLTARKRYLVIFGQHYSRGSFLSLNIRSNLPIVMPWIALSLVYDLLALIPCQKLHHIINSEWGDLLFFMVFLILVMVFFPSLVRRLWGCKPLPESPLKDHLVQFCKKQHFTADFYFWPLFEGRALTAGVMGLIPGLRYILLTPALINTLSSDELDAVMAHEIGHVKKRHLLLSILLIGGFSLFTGVLAEPLLYYAFSFDWVFNLITRELIAPEMVIALVGGIPLLILLLVYFRFIFAYFIRNFERQADLNVFTVFGNSAALISAFDKIAAASGQSKDKPSWHHFGIGQRIDYLQRCEQEPRWIERQDRKVNRSLGLYVLLLAALVFGADKIPTTEMARNYEEKYIELVLMSQGEDVENKALWYRSIGDLMVNRKMNDRAVLVYNKALEAEPQKPSPTLLNNFAWLLLTSSDTILRDPERALLFAKEAAVKNPQPHILDTLATAYWANGYVESALAVEQAAVKKAAVQKDYYRKQLERFRREEYTEQTDFSNN